MIDLIAKRKCPGWSEAETHLAKADPLLGEIIRRVGACTLSPRSDYFGALCQSIVNQQISTIAAMAVWKRFIALFPRRRPRPEVLLTIDDPTLRGAGLSRQKTAYLRSLSEAFASGAVPLRRLGRMTDEQIVQALIPIKGIGRWTAEMFLIFVLNRTDLLPVDDLGLRANAKRLYGLRNMPNAKKLNVLAEKWRPYRSIATWYLWRSASLKT
jgi:DNA-3-methyladenine glycosylase II